MKIKRNTVRLKGANAHRSLLLLWVFLTAVFTLQPTIRAENAVVLAKIGRLEITENDLLERLNKLPEKQKVAYEAKTGKKELLQEMVRLEVFYLEAIENRLNRKPVYKEKIERISKGILASAFVREYILSIDDISEKDAERFYKNNKEQYIEPEKINISSIFFQVNEKHPLKTAQEKVNKTLTRVQEGESFALLSEQISENSSPIKQDYFSRGRLDPAIENQVFDLKVGEISKAMQVEDGLILFKMNDKTPAKQLSFQEVQDKIVETLKEEKIKDAFYATEQHLYKKYQVSFNDAEKTQAKMDGNKPDIQGTIDRVFQSEDPDQASL
jgi:parvulin-like peptidyl-prolyl isomerase